MSESAALTIVPPAQEPRGELTESMRVRMTKSMVRRIQAVAGLTGRSNSDVARILIAVGLETYEREREHGKKK